MGVIRLDLEDIQVELEKAADLLCIYQDFVEYECPRGSMDKIDKVAAIAYSSRANIYTTAVDTAREKVLDVVEKLSEIIDDCYAEARKAKGIVDKC